MERIIVTVDDLKEIGACEDQIDIFIDAFGNEVEITRKILREAAVDFELDIEFWFIKTFPDREIEYNERSDIDILPFIEEYEQLGRIKSSMDLEEFIERKKEILKRDYHSLAMMIADMLGLP